MISYSGVTLTLQIIPLGFKKGQIEKIDDVFQNKKNIVFAFQKKKKKVLNVKDYYSEFLNQEVLSKLG